MDGLPKRWSAGWWGRRKSRVEKPALSARAPAGDGSRFATTHWSVVLAAADPATTESRAAFGALYEAYSQPLYGFVRRRGHPPADAQDLLHDFFHALIEKNSLQSVVRERGRFRAFLLGALRHFLANDWHRNQRAKRGGATTILSLDQMLAGVEQRLQVAATNGPDAEVLFDREWAHALLARVMRSLREEWAAAGRADQFAGLRVYLTRPGDGVSYQHSGVVLGMNEGAVKVAVHRLRRRFRELLHREVANTVGPAGDVEDELRHLVNVLRQEL